jgi:predicted outer membrane repeat protein
VPRRLRSLFIGFVLVGTAVPVTLAASAPSASASAVITVTSTNDGGPGSLRQAFLDANSSGVDTTIELTPGEYDLTDCTGPTDGGTLLYNAPAADLSLIGHGSTIRQTCPNASVIADLSTTGSLMVEGVWLTGATSQASGGAISSSTSGGVTVVDSTISGNSARVGGGGIAATGPIRIVNSTITANSVVGDITGGGIYVFGGDLSLVYSTVVDNFGGLFPGNTVANIWLAGGNLTSFGSVVALPRNDGLPNCIVRGTTTSHGYNFSDDSSCGFTGTGDRQAGDPQLGALDLSNGGGTPTMAANLGGPLVDAIPLSACQSDGAAGTTSDQRGSPRPGESISQCAGPDIQFGCDVGAFEDQYFVGPSCVGNAPAAPAPVPTPPRFTG